MIFYFFLFYKDLPVECFFPFLRQEKILILLNDNENYKGNGLNRKRKTLLNGI